MARVTEVIDTLKSKHAVLAVAESLTGGLITERITAVPGASEVLWGGFVVYTADAKVRLLQVLPDTINSHGVVSTEVARAMAKGAVDAMPADYKRKYGLAVTGIAGPSGGTASLPVGTVCIACVSCIQAAYTSISERYMFKGSRADVREQTCAAALEMLRYCLDKDEKNRL
ncbi:MAG: CinA family protein [Treponema sp.]